MANVPIFFCSPGEKWKPSSTKCQCSPLTLSNVVQGNTRIIHVGFQTKTTLKRESRGVLLFLFRGDGSLAQKLQNRRNCLNSFVRVCPSEHSNFAQSTKNKLVHTMAIAAIKMKFGALNLIKIYSITVLSPNTFVSSNSNGKHSIHSRNIQIDRQFNPNLRFCASHFVLNYMTFLI